MVIVALLISVIVFLTCCLVGIICYYLYAKQRDCLAAEHEKDILHIDEKYVDRYLEQEQEHKMDQIITKDGMAYMTYGTYDKFKNLSDTQQLKFRDAIDGMPIQMIPDSYFG